MQNENSVIGRYEAHHDPLGEEQNWGNLVSMYAKEEEGVKGHFRNNMGE